MTSEKPNLDAFTEDQCKALVGKRVRLKEQYLDGSDRLIGLSTIIQETRGAVFTIEDAWHTDAGEFTGTYLSLACEEQGLTKEDLSSEDAMYFEFVA